MDGIDLPTRMLLMRFACAFAWTDLELHEEERTRVLDLATRLGLGDEAHKAEIEGWLKSPPAADDLDPHDIPPSRRGLFLKECREIIEADGVLHPEEIDAFQLLHRILAGEDESEPLAIGAPPLPPSPKEV